MNAEFVNVAKRRASAKALAEMDEARRMRNAAAHGHTGAPQTDSKEAARQTEADSPRTKSVIHWFAASAQGNYRRSAARRPCASARFFRFAELLCHILPQAVRHESFEPAYFDEKADYLKARKKFKGLFARKWLVLCFSLRYLLLMAQSLAGMCSEKGKKAFWAALGGTILWLIRGR
jgi:hypothetical protein